MPHPPSAYHRFSPLSFKRTHHHKARHSLDSSADDYYHFVQPEDRPSVWIPPLQFGSPLFPTTLPSQPTSTSSSPPTPPPPISGLDPSSSRNNVILPANASNPLPRARTMSHMHRRVHSHDNMLDDVDWDPDFCLDEFHDESDLDRPAKPKFTIGDEDEDEFLASPIPSDDWTHHKPPLPRVGLKRRWTLGMALMDESISDEVLIRELERAVTIPRSSNRRGFNTDGVDIGRSPVVDLDLSPTTVRLITQVSSSPPFPLIENERHPKEGKEGYRSRPLPPLPLSPPLPLPRDEHAYVYPLPQASSHDPFTASPHPVHSLRNKLIHPHHPTFRRALLAVRELIRTEKTYLNSLRLLLEYPPNNTGERPTAQLSGYDDGGEDDSNELSSNSHSHSHGYPSPSRSTSFVHGSYHPFPSPPFPSAPSKLANTAATEPNVGVIKQQAKYTPPPLMRAYVVELVKVSEALVRKMERDLCVRGVADAFVGMCSDPTTTDGVDLGYNGEEEEDLGYASLENVYIAWCGAVGSWFADRSLSADDLEGEDGSRRKKEKGARLSKTRRLSSLVGHGREEKRESAAYGQGVHPLLSGAHTASPVQTAVPFSSSSEQPHTSVPSSFPHTLPPLTSAPTSANVESPNDKPLSPTMRSKSSTSLKRTMSQWRKSLPSMPSIPTLLGGSSAAAMTKSVYEGGPPLPPLPASFSKKTSGGIGVGARRGGGVVGAPRLRQQTLPPQLTMTTASGTVHGIPSRGGAGAGEREQRKAFEIHGRASIAFGEHVGKDSRRGLELRREAAFASDGRHINNNMVVPTKKSASLCDGGSIGVVVKGGSADGVARGRAEGVKGQGVSVAGAAVMRSKSAVVIRREGAGGSSGHGGSHLKKRLSGAILGGKVNGVDGGKTTKVPGEEELKQQPQQRQRKLPTVRDLAILPTQRVMRYVLLFRDLLAHTPPTSPSREFVEKAVDAAVRIAQKCDRAQGNAAFLRVR